jgi:hypothetical protein
MVAGRSFMSLRQRNGDQHAEQDSRWISDASGRHFKSLLDVADDDDWHSVASRQTIILNSAIHASPHNQSPCEPAKRITPSQSILQYKSAKRPLLFRTKSLLLRRKKGWTSETYLSDHVPTTNAPVELVQSSSIEQGYEVGKGERASDSSLIELAETVEAKYHDSSLLHFLWKKVRKLRKTFKANSKEHAVQSATASKSAPVSDERDDNKQDEPLLGLLQNEPVGDIQDEFILFSESMFSGLPGLSLTLSRSPADNIWTACRIGDVSFVRNAIAADPKSLNKIDTEGTGRSPLYLACHAGHESIVRLLLDMGIQDTDGTAYQSALNDSIRQTLREYNSHPRNSLPLVSNKKGINERLLDCLALSNSQSSLSWTFDQNDVKCSKAATDVGEIGLPPKVASNRHAPSSNGQDYNGKGQSDSFRYARQNDVQELIESQSNASKLRADNEILLPLQHRHNYPCQNEGISITTSDRDEISTRKQAESTSFPSKSHFELLDGCTGAVFVVTAKSSESLRDDVPFIVGPDFVEKNVSQEQAASTDVLNEQVTETRVCETSTRNKYVNACTPSTIKNRDDTTNVINVDDLFVVGPTFEESQKNISPKPGQRGDDGETCTTFTGNTSLESSRQESISKRFIPDPLPSRSISSLNDHQLFSLISCGASDTVHPTIDTQLRTTDSVEFILSDLSAVTSASSQIPTISEKSTISLISLTPKLHRISASPAYANTINQVFSDEDWLSQDGTNTEIRKQSNSTSKKKGVRFDSREKRRGVFFDSQAKLKKATSDIESPIFKYSRGSKHIDHALDTKQKSVNTNKTKLTPMHVPLNDHRAPVSTKNNALVDTLRIDKKESGGRILFRRRWQPRLLYRKSSDRESPMIPRGNKVANAHRHTKQNELPCYDVVEAIRTKNSDMSPRNVVSDDSDSDYDMHTIYDSMTSSVPSKDYHDENDNNRMQLSGSWLSKLREGSDLQSQEDEADDEEETEEKSGENDLDTSTYDDDLVDQDDTSVSMNNTTSGEDTMSKEDDSSTVEEDGNTMSTLEKADESHDDDDDDSISHKNTFNTSTTDEESERDEAFMDAMKDIEQELVDYGQSLSTSLAGMQSGINQLLSSKPSRSRRQLRQKRV